MKFIITENKRENVAFNWLDKHYSDLEPTYPLKYPEYIYFKKNGKIVFDYNKLTGYVLTIHELWSFLENVLNYSYEGAQEITKQWIESRYHLDVKRAVCFGDLDIVRWKGYNS